MKYYNPSLVRFTDAPRPFTVIDTNAESDARGAIDAKAAAEDQLDPTGTARCRGQINGKSSNTSSSAAAASLSEVADTWLDTG
jgi:hypothetical protein